MYVNVITNPEFSPELNYFLEDARVCSTQLGNTARKFEGKRQYPLATLAGLFTRPERKNIFYLIGSEDYTKGDSEEIPRNKKIRRLFMLS